MTFHHEIEAAERQVEGLKRAYLERWGWRWTCNSPGAFWMWHRDFAKEDAERHSNWKERGPGPYGWPSEPSPYGVITATTDLAILMTVGSLDHQPELQGDDDGEE